ncbi:replication protein A, subunit RPA32 [Neolentinus lepideus HHB14362 ss-1]|uniref:Replication protein A, subunit RPA32 n=1 Tax=Neolentinus lepideus HHB14362 ss-1 TaxID=1314782 RepID=A0A165TDU3_9AGAM|nr:replication protein A, subunit RPA32 [Neolentinus lepideus HHB14362 ss-1]
MSQQFGSNPYYQNNNTGGGYLTGSPYGGSPSSPGQKTRSAAAQSLRPVKAKQLAAATQAHADAEWKIEDVEVGQVTIVGHLVTIQPQTTNSVYWLDDGTGRVEARHWKGGDEDNDKWGDVSEGTFVRVTGTLKTFNGKRYINATHIRPVKEPMETYFHDLECVYVTHFFRHGPLGQGNEGASSTGTNMSNYTTQASTAHREEWAHLNPVQRAILEFMASVPDDNDEGVHVGAIARAVQGTAGVNDVSISTALDALMDDGRIYTTTDESHFRLS